VEPPKAPEKVPAPKVIEKPAEPDFPEPKAPAPKAPEKPAEPVAPEPKAPVKPPVKAPEKKPEEKDPFGGINVNTLRMWTDASGKYQLEARLVSFHDGTVRLQKTNGCYVRVAYDKLCALDQDFVLDQDQCLLAME
jgi:hypothetical protein